MDSGLSGHGLKRSLYREYKSSKRKSSGDNRQTPGHRTSDLSSPPAQFNSRFYGNRNDSDSASDDDIFIVDEITPSRGRKTEYSNSSYRYETMPKNKQQHKKGGKSPAPGASSEPQLLDEASSAKPNIPSHSKSGRDKSYPPDRIPQTGYYIPPMVTTPMMQHQPPPQPRPSPYPDRNPPPMVTTPMMQHQQPPQPRPSPYPDRNQPPVLTTGGGQPQQPPQTRPSPYPESVRKEVDGGVDAACELFMEQLSSQNEFVTTSKVRDLTLQHFGVRNLSMIHRNYHRDIDVPCLRRINMMQRKVTTYIQAFTDIRSVATLHELNRCLSDFMQPGAKTFTDLNLGPLCKQPVIYDLYKLPGDAFEIPKIEASDVLNHLKGYLSKNKLWNSRAFKLDMVEFMNYMAEQYEFESEPFRLGVKISSIPLAINCIKRSQRDDKILREDGLNAMVDHLKADINKEIRARELLIRQSIPGASPMGTAMLRLQKLNPGKAVLEVYKAQTLLFTTLSEWRISRTLKTKYRDAKKAIDRFLDEMSCNDLCSLLFQLAICCSNCQTPQDVWSILPPPVIPLSGSGEFQLGCSMPADSTTSKLPSKSQLQGKLRSYLEKFADHLGYSMKLSTLVRLENHLTDDFSCQSFGELKQGPFLEFLCAQADVLNELGIGQTVGGSEARGTVSKSDVLFFIKQFIGLDMKVDNETILVQTMQDYYGVEDVKDLGFGPLRRLLNMVGKQDVCHSRLSIIIEAVLVPRLDTTSIIGANQVNKDTAVFMLKNAPLLVNISSYTQWDNLFLNELGPLKEFLKKNCDKMGINVLEISPNGKEFLLLSVSSSPASFADSVRKRLANDTAGHLTSIVAKSGGIKTAPLALLCNHMKASLNAWYTAAVVEGSKETDAQTIIIRFVLDCMLATPNRIRSGTATQIFLNPLTDVIGSSKSHSMLLAACKTPSELSVLHQLGFILGIQEWMDHFYGLAKTKTQPLQPQFSMDEVFKTDDKTTEELVLNKSLDVDDTNGSDILNLNSDDDSSATKSENSDDWLDISDSDSIYEDAGSDISDDHEISTDIVQEEENIHKALIDKIRRTEFGVGVELSGDVQLLVQKNQDRLGRSLDRLSKELYSKDTHFVLELIQNADDNHYSNAMLSGDSDDVPSLFFYVQKDCITLFNNETGFSEANIRAVCDVGRTTKGKHVAGYIGQKGIGFKSVFRVTDRPEIHSNGFHICFDCNSGPMGYILPHWISESIRYPTIIDCDNLKQWHTSISLPLKEEMRTSSLAAKFCDIHPSILLFLNRLKSITILNEVEGRSETMTRCNLENNVVEMCYKGKQDHWLIYTLELEIPDYLTVKNALNTYIALGFPMEIKDTDEAAVFTMNQQWPVFAFLPLRSYGFHFLLQADFEVPSSREDIDQDSAWNQWLAEQIPTFFVQCIDKLQEQPGMNSISALCVMLQYLPLPNEVVGFFGSVASNIIQILKGQAFLPSTSDPVSWHQPCQVIYSKDPLFADVIPDEQLFEMLALHYLHPIVAACLAERPGLAETLGIRQLDTSHILEIGSSSAVELSLVWEDMDNEDRVHAYFVIAKWMACLERSIDSNHLGLQQTLTDQLHNVPIIPLVDGRLVSFKSLNVIFFANDSSNIGVGSRDYKHLLKPLISDLPTISPQIMLTTDEVINYQVRKLLEMIGVKQISPSDVINKHILPTLRSNNLTQSKSKETIVAYTIYIFLALEYQPNLCSTQDLKDNLVLLTSTNEFILPLTRPLHFSKAFKNPLLINQNLKWSFVNNVYLGQNPNNAANIQAWRRFLSTLGVVDGLFITKRNVAVAAGSPTGFDAWDAVVSDVRDEYVIEDWCSPEIDHLLGENEETLDIGTKYYNRKFLFSLLNSEWDNRYINFTSAMVKDNKGNRVKDTLSSFALKLKSLPWLPCTKPGWMVLSERSLTDLEEELSLYLSDIQYVRPNDAVTWSTTIFKLAYIHIPYLTITNYGKRFIEFLGIRRDIGVDDCWNLALTWSKAPDLSQQTAVQFQTSLTHMTYFYKHILDNMPGTKLLELFSNNNFIWIPENCNKPSKPVDGIFQSKQDLFWDEPTKVQKKYRLESLELALSLSTYYSDSAFKHLFVEIAGVPTSPPLKIYAKLLIIICSKISASERVAVEDVFRLYITLMKCCCYGDASSAEEMLPPNVNEMQKLQLKRLLEDHLVFPTKKHDFIKASSKLMVADDKFKEDLFTGKIDFLNLPHSYNNKHESKQMINQFLELFNIRKISVCVNEEINPEQQELAPEVQEIFFILVPAIQRFLYTNFQDIYSRLIEKDNIGSKLRLMVFYRTKSLEVIYRLKYDLADVYKITHEKCKITNNEAPLLYILKAEAKNEQVIIEQLATIFSRGDPRCKTQLKLFLSAAYGKRDGGLDKLLKTTEIPYLPENEDIWSVKEPIIYREPPRPKPVPPPVPPPSADTPRVQPTGPPDSGGKLRCWPPPAPGGNVSGHSKQDKPVERNWPEPPPRPKENETPVVTRKPDHSQEIKERRSAAADMVGDGDGDAHREREREGGMKQGEELHLRRVDNSSVTERGGIVSKPFERQQLERVNNSSVTGGDTIEGVNNSYQRVNDPPSVVPTTSGVVGEIPIVNEQPADESREKAVVDCNIVRARGESYQQPTGHRPYYHQPDDMFRRLKPPRWLTAEKVELTPIGVGWDCLGLPRDDSRKLSGILRTMGRDSEESELYRREVSRWGEQLVYMYLVATIGHQANVVWVNANISDLRDDSGTPYDIVIEPLQPPVDNFIETRYVEVKSTSGLEKDFFEISVEQLRLALLEGPNYHLYRVFGAGDIDNFRLECSTDLSKLMYQNVVKLVMVI